MGATKEYYIRLSEEEFNRIYPDVTMLDWFPTFPDQHRRLIETNAHYAEYARRKKQASQGMEKIAFEERHKKKC